MYGGRELEQAVDKSFAFLDDISTDGTLNQRRKNDQNPTSSNRSDRQPVKPQVKFGQPRFKSVRELPGYEAPKGRDNEMRFKRSEVEARFEKVQEGEWESMWGKDNERRLHERQRQERIEMALQSEWEKELRRREAEAHKRREIEIEMEREKRIDFRVEATRREADKRQVEEEIRKWKVHPPLVLSSKPQERARYWEVYPSGSERLQEWKQEQKPAIGTYFPSPKVPDGSSLLKRTNNYLDPQNTEKPLERRSTGDRVQKLIRQEDQKVNPLRNSEKHLENHRISRADRIQQPLIPDPPPEDRRVSVAERVQQLLIPQPPPLPTYNPEDVNGSITGFDIIRGRSALKPIEKRIIEDKTYETEPKTFKEKLNRLLAFQLETHQRLGITKAPLMEPIPDSATKYKTVKTLSKAAMKDKLEEILVKGPQKPSFRGDADIEDKRRKAVAKLRAIENEARDVRPRDDLPPVRNSDFDGRQKMLMGDVLATIKLKGSRGADPSK